MPRPEVRHSQPQSAEGHTDTQGSRKDQGVGGRGADRSRKKIEQIEQKEGGTVARRVQLILPNMFALHGTDLCWEDHPD